MPRESVPVIVSIAIRDSLVRLQKIVLNALAVPWRVGKESRRSRQYGLIAFSRSRWARIRRHGRQCHLASDSDEIRSTTDPGRWIKRAPNRASGISDGPYRGRWSPDDQRRVGPETSPADPKSSHRFADQWSLARRDALPQSIVVRAGHTNRARAPRDHVEEGGPALRAADILVRRESRTGIKKILHIDGYVEPVPFQPCA